MSQDQDQKHARGKGKGSNFFALGRDVWERLQTCDTSNRLNFILTYLVLLAGTGSDHRLTKWSAKACEQYVGLGKPRARHAIDELIGSGLVSHTDASTRLKPQYLLPELPREAEPIFLPVQAVTGFAGETPVLQRIRETGDALTLALLIDLYGRIQTDATYGLPLSELSQGGRDSPAAKKAREVGVYKIWALNSSSGLNASGAWTAKHRLPLEDNIAAWGPFWDRLNTLKSIGALWYEPWVYDGETSDAEPIIPVDPGVFFTFNPQDDEAKLTMAAYDAAQALIADQGYLLDRTDADIIIPLSAHRRAPALRGVARLRIEPDTPGRRWAFKQRRLLIERYQEAFNLLKADAESGRFDRPMQLRPALAAPTGLGTA